MSLCVNKLQQQPSVHQCWYSQSLCLSVYFCCTNTASSCTTLKFFINLCFRKNSKAELGFLSHPTLQFTLRLLSLVAYWMTKCLQLCHQLVCLCSDSSIRPYVADVSKDLLCPKPAEPQSAVFKEPSSSPTPDKATDTLPSVVRASPKRGFCHQTGHRNSIIRGKFTCPERKEWIMLLNETFCVQFLNFIRLLFHCTTVYVNLVLYWLYRLFAVELADHTK